MKILVINAGSSSIKYQLFDMDNELCIAKGLAENIGSENAVLKHYYKDNQKIELRESIHNHEEALLTITEILTHSEYGVIRSLNEISAIGHRVAHGGERLFKPVIIDQGILRILKDNIRLAPIHMPNTVNGIEICAKLLPNIPMIAVFDTAFHQTIPEKAYLYPIPYEFYTKYGIRRYGFHGISHKYVATKAAQILHQPIQCLKMITCHLGSGSSMAAICYGQSVDTTMGFTPTAGLPMATRCGDIDPMIVGFLMDAENMTYKQVEDVLNKKSGFLGLSGITNDCKELIDLSKKGNKRARKTLDIFCYSIKKYIGAYATVMGGLDCLVFTGGIGENSAFIRHECCSGLEFIGVSISPQRNEAKSSDILISSDDSKVKVFSINTNEELMIARETMQMI